VFHVEHDGHDRWLDTHWDYPDRHWFGSYRRVFLRRK
jgi:hypothetical protein